MYDYVHVDEKWFYLTKVKRRYYVYDDEEVAARSVKSKKFITKVMFLAAVARPRFDHHSKKQWDGKLGVWPFVHVSPAARASKNRPKGTLHTVPLAVDAKVYSDAIMDKVVPSIQLKFPGDWRRRQVLIQQDNASPHRRVTSEFLQQQGIRKAFVDYVKDYAVSENKHVRVKSRGGNNRTVVCTVPLCPFLVTAYKRMSSTSPTQPFVLSFANVEHMDCTSSAKPSARQIANISSVNSAVHADRRVSAAFVQSQEQVVHSVNLDTRQRNVYRAKKYVRDELETVDNQS
ncbi:hypothetical protein H257_02242 [Aphanomyces astaci]|uniref:Uncharacterized protein n=1 Tax=Aphanomyces astaci TaxID=112090 RepID=W4H3A3_APHAT|nr:hypothetical protein H257_02242 [Aphanomyces astaci]ETV85623.1 hypothetical protein H257_02242 [Aphanomyces astaci]|eukprot:XP_009824095.1 hypothetical protein H257_02242 [Aphanomyces astaci]